MTARKIAVIGGGASATLLLAHLARSARLPPDISVDIYDRSGRFGRGIAYSTTHDGHLLNVRAGNMSAYQEDKGHFALWAAAKGYTDLDFVPRKLYGDYLQGVLSDAQKIVPVRFIEEDVVSSIRDGTGYRLKLAGGDHAGPAYDQVVLASGNVRALRPVKDEAEVAGYYDDPWTVDMAALLRAERIALIGSGLTAVDMVLALADRGYGGEIMIFSRNALLPAEHVDPVPFPSFLDGVDESLSPLRLLQKIRRTVRASDVPWQAVIDSLRPYTNTIWQTWDAGQKRAFSRRLLTFWNIHRHRMAPRIAQTVQTLRADGRLQMVKAGVNSVASGPVLKTVRGDYAAGAVVNCLGYRYDERDGAYVVSHRLGPARFGILFETTAIPEIRVQSHSLADELLA